MTIELLKNNTLAKKATLRGNKAITLQAKTTATEYTLVEQVSVTANWRCIFTTKTIDFRRVGISIATTYSSSSSSCQTRPRHPAGLANKGYQGGIGGC